MNKNDKSHYNPIGYYLKDNVPPTIDLNDHNNLVHLCDTLWWFYNTTHITDELESKVFSLFDDIMCILCKNR